MLKISKIVIISICLIILSGIVFAQDENMAFPQSIQYTNAINLSEALELDVDSNDYKEEVTDMIKTQYGKWKEAYIKEADKTNNGYYIEMSGTGGVSEEKSTSEAMGYGMLILVAMAGSDEDGGPGNKTEQHYFDGMLKMVEKFKSEYDDNLMCWYIPESEKPDEWDPGNKIYPCNATDGDMDIAYSLLMAHEQWGSDDTNYYQKAIDRIKAMRKHNLMYNDYANFYWLNTSDNCGPDGTDADGRNLSRPSDWMTGHMMLFYGATRDKAWSNAANKAGIMLSQIADDNTGLVPDFVRIRDNSGIVKHVDNDHDPEAWEFPTDAYDYNACRVPWRIASGILENPGLNRNWIRELTKWVK